MIIHKLYFLSQGSTDSKDECLKIKFSWLYLRKQEQWETKRDCIEKGGYEADPIVCESRNKIS